MHKVSLLRSARARSAEADCTSLGSKLRKQRLGILGTEVTPTDIERTCADIERWIAEGRREYVCVTGAHGIIESRRDARVHQAHAQAGMVVPDGMPLVFMARHLGFPDTSRVYGPDLMRRLTAISAARGYRQFYYGGPPGLADALSLELRSRHRKLQVAGTLAPPFRSQSEDEDAREVDIINSARPDIVWVGLSTPKQELWMSAHRERLNAPVLIGIGAAFDFLAGTKRQAPVWMQKKGLEWSYRLMSEPRRLWKRYARIVPTFAALAVCQLLLEGTDGRYHADG